MPAILAHSNNVARVLLSGDLDFSSQEELKAVFEQAVQAGGDTVEVDLEETTFMDSAIIRLLLKLREMAGRNDKSLVILNCNERIAEIFAIGGFDKIFDIR